MYGLLKRLDDAAFLGFRIWEFSFRSLRRRYSLTFLARILLRHPANAIAGVSKYRRLVRANLEQSDITMLFEGPEDDLVSRLATARRDLLVAVGFCQKPMGAPGVGCPAGRFNHDCRVLARDDVLEVQAGRLPIACRGCGVRVIGTAALRAGAVVYIMTSAADIARHLFIPTLEGGRFRHGLFLQCPYSIPAMILPLLICHIQSLLVGYGEGDCRDYAQFLLADGGTKGERTYLNPTAHAHVLDFLQDVASARRARGRHYRRFHRDGFLHVPAIET